MSREPVKCRGCGTYLSGKNRDSKEQKCNSCTGGVNVALINGKLNLKY